MGDPRKFRKKFTGPSHPWEGERIEGERKLIITYGLKNKKEIWKLTSKIRTYKKQVKKLTALATHQAEREKEQLQKKLVAYGLLEQHASLDAVLGLPVTSLMERRLQTVVYKKNLARSVKQARQFIVHGHILINGRKMTSPSHLVAVNEEPTITFFSGSTLSSADHPERAPQDPKKEGRKNKEKQARENNKGRRREGRKRGPRQR